ncbi:hypothetical protein ANCCAN_09407 [Ancylostoma caninum]|uniref:Uncharacterized protein n=1 Tax=Ancylostoma caninum TaxID=29170 RepID=A0A368GNT3_ANCCA|nr:hypothetical protein ANCCAN_09407 [Ancylostoma caninum]
MGVHFFRAVVTALFQMRGTSPSAHLTSTIFGGNSSYFFEESIPTHRYIQAGARRGMMPTMLSLIHPDNDSPRPAAFFHTILSMAFCLIGDIYTLVNYLTVTALLSTMFSVGALAYIKWKKIPVSTTAVKFHIIWPILNFLINAALIVIPVIVEPIKSAVGFGLFILGIVSYFLFVRPTKKMRFLMKLDALTTFVTQQLSWTVVEAAPTYKKENEAERSDAVTCCTEENQVRRNPADPVTSSTTSSSLSRRKVDPVQDLSVEKL